MKNEKNGNKNLKSAESNESQVAETAYQLWEKAGRPDGRAMDFWLEAEQQVRAGSKQPARSNYAL